ncbi:glycosyltransferase [Solidesulfovibrio sp.]|uniref:glycosyltransferase n=1 Tax=Solidesulfovibrio sp. TaxID=2910990 RepID=UPI00263186A7|nr:glycosyltransferase [Solidesulfovibrio sp.]
MGRPSRPARVVMLLQDLAFGGTQRQALELGARLDRARFAPEFWMLTAVRDFAPHAQAAGIPLTWLSPATEVGAAPVASLWKKLAHDRPDLLVPLTAVPNIWGRVFGRLRGLPAVIGTCRGGGAVKRQHERLLKGLVRHHIVNAASLKDALVRLGRPESAVTCIANGVDTAYFAPPPEELRPVREVILCPARFCEDKDHETLIQAFAFTAAKRPRAELWLVGDGPLRTRVRTLAARSPVRGLIRTYPAAPDPRPFFQQASVVALSSVREGLPNVLLEAMSMGIPVAATAVGGIPDLVEPGRTGLLSPPGDARALGENLAALLADEALRRDFGDAARQRVLGHFSMERMVRRHEDVFEKVLSEAAGQ